MAGHEPPGGERMVLWPNCNHHNYVQLPNIEAPGSPESVPVAALDEEMVQSAGKLVLGAENPVQKTWESSRDAASWAPPEDGVL